MKSKGCVAILFSQRRTEHTSYQIFRPGIDGKRRISHPNLLPVIEISELPFPFCIMSPWMSNGNITQYIQVNPDANRLMLVLARQLKIDYV